MGLSRRKISVIVPTYDRPVMFRQAIASIRALEAEGDDIEFEIIVGDNGLKNETLQTCKELGAIYVPAPGKGSSYGRNAAMKVATGEFIAFLDDDDVWLSGCMRPHVAFLDANPHLDAVFGQAIYADPDLKPLGPPWPAEHPGEGDAMMKTMLSGLFPQVGTFLARMKVVEQVGYFDTHLVGGQDLDWLMRLSRQRKLGFVPVPCILFRGRPARSYDALQRKRIGFDRHVFLRHGLPEAHRLWTGPLDFMRSYHGTLRHYYLYFIDKANWFVENGQRGEAVKALVTPMINLPLLAIADLVRPSELRTAIGNVMRGRLKQPLTAEAT
ncbi:probable glycosyl transferase [alpha proteobacterium U9-1i]|nr:probable glycosyl transferase [alpha proteobacterium U9-1i]